jgi:hypothetical protein
MPELNHTAYVDWQRQKEASIYQRYILHTVALSTTNSYSRWKT